MTTGLYNTVFGTVLDNVFDPSIKRYVRGRLNEQGYLYLCNIFLGI
jgi:hypothetical protein